MSYTRFLVFFSFIFIANLAAAQKSYRIFQDFKSRSSEEIVAAIRNGLASKNPVYRDRTVMFLATLINTGKNSLKEQKTVFKLAENREIISLTADIVAEHLVGWYEERESAQERSMPMSYSLIHLLSISPSKTAGITLLMALPMVGFDAFFRKSILTNELALKFSFSKLVTIENKLCCSYPGKEPVADMLAIDVRLNLLKIYLEEARNKGISFLRNDFKVKKFIAGCLVFGDAKKGGIIRSKAVELACLLIKHGYKEFIPTVEKIAESDPYYLYRLGTQGGSNSLPCYDIKSKYYPVRERARKELDF